MADGISVDWLTCDKDGCIGVRLNAGDKCLADAGDEELQAALKQVTQTGKIDARGVTISSTLLKAILDSAPRNPGGHAMPTEALFDRATFQGKAGFDGVTFLGNARFSGATFEEASFRGATFHGNARFSGVTFRNAWFRWARFEGGAWFNEATFLGNVGFGEATFHNAWFSSAIFQGDARFGETTFQGNARFNKATFLGDARFGETTFQGDAGFEGVTFQDNALFSEAVFERAQQFGPLLAHRGLNLDGVQFTQPVRIEASTIRMCCRRARFPGGVQFRLRWAGVVLDDTEIPAPSLLTGIPRLASDELASAEQQISRDWERQIAQDRKQKAAGHVSGQPRLLSLQRANVAGLVLANVDPAGCRFSGAHNLDKLRLEADVTFSFSPGGVGWEQRQVIAEECAWRADKTRSGRRADAWWPDQADDPWWPKDLAKPVILAPGAIAGLYRALRKSREDTKDEPGAADFYYGEMEMRRHARGQADREDSGSRGRVDRGILTAYWLVSGYGLRAWRALAWLAGITVAFALGFHLIGFIRPPRPATYWTSLLYAFRSTISITDNEVTLTAWGQLLQALLRLTGPVLLGLALLALRGRVKR